MIENENEKAEIFLKTLYQSISSNGTVTEKLNVLTYFETLIYNQVAANRFINSEFLTIFI